MAFLRKRWEQLAAAILIIGPYIGSVAKALDKVVGWGGSIDFIIARSQSPDWVGRVMTFLLDPPELLRLLCLLAGIFLIIRAERGRTDRKLAIVSAVPVNVEHLERPAQGSSSPNASGRPDWPLSTVVQLWMKLRPPDEGDITRSHYYNQLALEFADIITLNGLTLWGRHGGFPLAKIPHIILSRSTFTFRDGTCVLGLMPIDSMNISWYTDLMLNKAESERFFFDVVSFGGGD